MASPPAWISGTVSRALPNFNADNANTDVKFRQDEYGGLITSPAVRKAHVLANEGSYYITNNAQTAIVPTYGTAFAAASPFILIYNGNATQRLFLDYIALTAVVLGTCTTTAGYTACAVLIDNINRYSSAGTNLTANIVSPNMATPTNASGASVYCGAIVANTASGAVRVISGLRNLRPGVSTTVINAVGDMHLLNFGGVEGAVGSITVANANIMPQAMPPVILGPGHSALIYLFYPVMTAPAAATYAPEIGFWVR